MKTIPHQDGAETGIYEIALVRREELDSIVWTSRSGNTCLTFSPVDGRSWRLEGDASKRAMSALNKCTQLTSISDFLEDSQKDFVKAKNKEGKNPVMEISITLPFWVVAEALTTIFYGRDYNPRLSSLRFRGNALALPQKQFADGEPNLLVVPKNATP